MTRLLPMLLAGGSALAILTVAVCFLDRIFRRGRLIDNLIVIAVFWSIIAGAIQYLVPYASSSGG